MMYTKQINCDVNFTTVDYVSYSGASDQGEWLPNCQGINLSKKYLERNTCVSFPWNLVLLSVE